MDDLARDGHIDLDDAIFTLPAEGLGSAQSALGRTRLRTFITLRWLAVAGQTAAVLFVAFGLGFDMPLALCLSIIAASAWLNVFLSFAFQSQRLTRGWEATLQLAFDTVQLAALIAATGGLSNPFLLLLVAPVTVAALSLSSFRASLIALLALVLAALMPLIHMPLPWGVANSSIALPPLFQLGQFAALAVGVVFFALSAARGSQDEARLVRALDAAGVVMAREQRLSALGAMSAMTTHELGTPLATIHLVAKELQADLDPEDPRAEDIILIAEQADRCRAILATIREAREATDIVHARIPLDALVAEGRIRRFTVETDVDAEGAVRAIALVELQGALSRSVIRTLTRIPGVSTIHATNGAWDLVVEIRTDSLVNFDRVLREIRDVPGVLNSESCLLLAHVAG